MAAEKITYTDKEQGQSNPAPSVQKLEFGDANEIKSAVNSNADLLGGLNLAGSTAVTWNEDFKTINIPTGTGSTLQVGQEFYFLIHNDTGIQINNGQILKPVNVFTVGTEAIITIILAKADNHETCSGTLFVATSDIAIGAVGMGTRLGRAGGLNTLGCTPGADLWVSATVAGGFTEIRPSFPNYSISVGGVLVIDETNGQVAVSFQRRVEDTILDAWDGSMRENFDFLVASDGATITGSLTKSSGGDLTLMFSDGFTILDTTPGRETTLTPGTDTVPVLNYIYILKSDKILTVSTIGWPVLEHAKIAQVHLYSAALTQTDGALINHNWNDHVKSEDDNGHLVHITERLRQYPAQWNSGVQLTSTLIGASTPDDLFISVTDGDVYQLHKHDFDALDTQAGDFAYVHNHFTTKYLKVTNLNVLILDSEGVTLNNRSFSFVVWGVVNKSGEQNHLMVNIPSGSYAFNSPSNALEDSNNFAVYTIPNEFTGTGFLISRLVLTYKNDVWTVENEIDLRGTFPNTTAGAGGSAIGIPDAPVDGNTYGRKDGGWVILP